MNLCTFYTLGTICAYLLLALPAILGNCAPKEKAYAGFDSDFVYSAEEETPMWVTIAELVGRVMLFIVGASVCSTLIKASRRAAPHPHALLLFLVAQSPLHGPCLPPRAGATPTTRTRHDPPLPGEQVRQELRNQAQLSGSSCEDGTYSWFCTCCTTIQLACS